MENDTDDEKEKINQPKANENSNDDFPKEFEEHRSENLRMKPQPLEKPKKEEDNSDQKNS